MTHRYGFSEFSVRSLYCRDAGHHKMQATRPESSEMPPIGSPPGRVGGRQQALTMPRIAGGSLLARHVPQAIPMGHYYLPLV